jgi:hypothetical protein
VEEQMARGWPGQTELGRVKDHIHGRNWQLFSWTSVANFSKTKHRLMLPYFANMIIIAGVGMAVLLNLAWSSDQRLVEKEVSWK